MKEIRIGENIAALRKNSRTTQEQLAQALHISPQAVSKWEKGISYPDTETMAGIAEYFHVTIDFLYYGKAENSMENSKHTGIRAKDRHPNWLIYSYWKEEDLDALSDEEFRILRQKVTFEYRSIEYRSEKFTDFFAGKNGADLITAESGRTEADYFLYRQKSMADNLNITHFFALYERIFTFLCSLGIRNLFDLCCMPFLQSAWLVHYPDMRYTAVSDPLFHHPHIEESYVNKLFEDFTGSDRIRYIREEYPCDLDIPENSAAIAVWTHRLAAIVAWEEDKLRKLASQFDRFIIELVGRTNNTDLSNLPLKDVIYGEHRNFNDIREEQLANLKELLPQYEIYRLSDNPQNFILYGTRCPSDRDTILRRYDLIGDRIVSDMIPPHWSYELRTPTLIGE